MLPDNNTLLVGGMVNGTFADYLKDIGARASRSGFFERLLDPGAPLPGEGTLSDTSRVFAWATRTATGWSVPEPIRMRGFVHDAERLENVLTPDGRHMIMAIRNDEASGEHDLFVSTLGGYVRQSCDTFTGEWRGTTNVEALHKGDPFYRLLNDWSATVEIAAPRADPSAPADAGRPLRGTITGRATNFKVVNELRTLYAHMPASSLQFLTTDPSPAQQEGATFVAAVEGVLRGNQMTLKVRPGGVDYAGRVTGKLAVIVIAMASPVPQVQVFDVLFMGGNWQLMRAIGPDGTADRPFTVTVGGDKRLVRAQYPRTLTSAGARGQFSIDIRLCAGCD